MITTTKKNYLLSVATSISLGFNKKLVIKSRYSEAIIGVLVYDNELSFLSNTVVVQGYPFYVLVDQLMPDNTNARLGNFDYLPVYTGTLLNWSFEKDDLI